MATFAIQPIDRFARPGSKIKRPAEIACFSYDDSHEFHLDESSLKYYYTPTLGVSLCAGYEEWRKIDEVADEHLDSLLKTIQELERKQGKRVEANFITWRGMMTKIMAAPYSGNFDSFEMNATCFQGTIFIEENREFKLESRARQESQVTRPGMASQEMMTYWGYKFETLCLLPQPWGETSRGYIENREHATVSNYAQYCSVVQTGIGNSTLILGGEIDAVWDMKPTIPTHRTNWVELKTSAEIRSEKDVIKFERKLHKFWIQSFLLGVPKIIVGFRSNDAEGKLLRVQEFETTKIPAMVRNQGKRTWDSNVCINFAEGFLEFLKETVRGQGVWRIRRRDRSSIIEMEKYEETGTGSILSDDFLRWRSQPLPDDNSQVQQT